MSTEANKAIVRRWVLEGWRTGNTALIEELFAEDYVNRTPQPGQAPDRSGIAQVVSMIHATFSDLQVELEDLIAEGDRVAVRDRTLARHTGPFAGVAPTNASVRVDRIAIFRLREGRIVEAWTTVDIPGLMRQLEAARRAGEAEA